MTRMLSTTPAGLPAASSRAQSRARLALVALGVGILAIGGVVLLLDVNPKSYGGIAIWFLAAIVLHDGILSPIVFGIGVLMRRNLMRLSPAVVVIVQAGLVVVTIMTAIVLPEIIKQGIGVRNSSILPLPYGMNLGAFVFGVLIAGAVSVAVYAVAVTRRQKVRPSSTQD